jgi:hypothetical protein
MARRKRSRRSRRGFKGTPEQHASAARTLVKELARSSRRLRKTVAKGDCRGAIKDLLEVSGLSSAYFMERAWLAHAGIKKLPKLKGQKAQNAKQMRRIFKVCSI